MKKSRRTSVSRPAAPVPPSILDAPAAPLYVDPISLDVPARPYVLSLCGHTLDACYLYSQEERALTQQYRVGFACPICNMVSPLAIRNYALETALGLKETGGPARYRPGGSLSDGVCVLL